MLTTLGYNELEAISNLTSSPPEINKFEQHFKRAWVLVQSLFAAVALVIRLLLDYRVTQLQIYGLRQLTINSKARNGAQSTSTRRH